MSGSALVSLLYFFLAAGHGGKVVGTRERVYSIQTRELLPYIPAAVAAMNICYL